ncbi:MAG TPA: ACT domain-containing protein [Candidatus Omnitrophota bacterium]|nr:ACT domain-containing protein [Candidatus Omnitrophota bacterium]HPT08025.1 ACT domain-containing protein [Candidatus Omnitrophota bacterium]
MKINQISIFVENRKGRLYQVCKLLGDNAINIRALNVAETQDFGVLRMVVDKPQEALNLLKENGFTASFSEIVAVEVEDKPGGLANILKVLNDSNVNIEYMYAFVEKKLDKALLVFRFENIDKALETLTKAKVKIVTSDAVVKA